MSPRSTRTSVSDDEDRLGFDQTTNYLANALGKFVPRSLARRSIAVSVSTDADRYERDEPVEITVEFRNRLPVPVSVFTPTRRLWGWSVDGQLEASDEPRYVGDAGGRFDFRGGERKRVTIMWDGRFKRAGDPDTWTVADPGEYEISAFLATGEPGSRPEDSTTVRIE